jgi:phospholipase C
MPNYEAPAGIDHVIVLMLENASFDRVFGGLQGTLNVDGVDRTAAPRKNRAQDSTGHFHDFEQTAGAARWVKKGTPHEFKYVRWQIGNGAMDGFAAAYHAEDIGSHNPLTFEEQSEVMYFFERGTLPAFHALAEQFVVCDRWFSSVPGPTWPNRLFALSGTSKGKVLMPDSLFTIGEHWYDQKTVFQALQEKGVRSTVYAGDFPLSLLLVDQRRKQRAAQHSRLSKFLDDVASFKSGANNALPRFSFLEPNYTNVGHRANDAHPPHDILETDRLVASVYNAVRQNSDLWQRCLIVITFDEHGGFYDHVPPPPTIAPDNDSVDYPTFHFDQLGPRVPTLLISPWLKAGVLGASSGGSRDFDHTSLLRFLNVLWGTTGLGARAEVANTFANVPGASDNLFLPTMRHDTPNKLPETTPLSIVTASMEPSLKAAWMTPPAIVPPTKLSDLEKSIIGLATYLETLTPGVAPTVALEHHKASLASKSEALRVATERASAFIVAAKN